MSTIIGTKGSDHLVGSPDNADTIIGDPFSGGLGGAADNGRLLSSGTGGNDLIEGLGGANEITGAVDELYGDAFQIAGTGHGGTTRSSPDRTSRTCGATPSRSAATAGASGTCWSAGSASTTSTVTPPPCPSTRGEPTTS